MPSNSTYVCVKDREVSRGGHCPVCHQPMRSMGPKWRAPKRRNERAWRRIEAGEMLWDREATVRSLVITERWREWRASFGRKRRSGDRIQPM